MSDDKDQEERRDHPGAARAESHGAPPAAAQPPADLARLAHELRTPLSAIAVLSEIMRDERLGSLGSPRYQSYAADIHESAMHAMSVLAGFLDPQQQAKATAGRGAGLPMDFVELNLAELVTGTVSTLVPLAERSGVRLEAHVAAGLPHLIADRRSLRQILNNLIANALKFTPPGGTVSVAARYQVGGPVTLEVADTGDGMTPAELDRARAGATAPEPFRRRSGGTGFGLPMVRALAAAGGASVTVDSVLRQGTRVAIAFPHDRVVLS